MKLFVKKVWSWHPTKYEYISLKQALKNYHTYILAWNKSPIKKSKKQKPKKFNDWLITEI